MEPAGMVHALEKIHRLLAPQGRLIDIHPIGVPPSIEVRVGSQVTCVGRLKESDDFVEYGQASDALAQAVRRGLFVVERESTFPYVIYAGSVAELREYLAREWKDAIVDVASAGKAQELLGGPERDKELILRDEIRIVRLKPTGRVIES
jgi:hypothetical protein